MKDLQTIFEIAFLDFEKALELAKKLSKYEVPKKKLLALKEVSGNQKQTTLIERLLIIHYPVLEILLAIKGSADYYNKLQAKTILLNKYPQRIPENFLRTFLNDSEKKIRIKAKNLYVKRFG